MSRIGKMPVTVPMGVEVFIEGQDVRVKGPKGELAHTVAEPITVARGEDGSLEVARPDDERESKALHGLSRSLINNMVLGVTEGYEKKLEIVGVGYRVMARGQNAIELNLGFSHPVKFEAPEGITFSVESPDEVRGARHRQADGRRGRREHPQAPQARALQGQGRALRRRTRPAQGRKGW